jgi:soluble lytic murein transglycosylase-like protein
MSSDAVPMSLPVPTTGAENPPIVFDDGTGVGATPAGDAQIAQLPQRAPQQRTPSTHPTPEGTGKLPPSDLRRQVRATTAASRLIAWDEITRKALPERIDPRLQQPLPDDWEAALTKTKSNYLKMTKAAAQKYGIPPELLARLFYKESTYDRNKVSDAGARGIAQLMPVAVRELGLNPNTFDYFNAEKSINAGAALLAKYHGEFKDWPKAVAAYNMGNTALREWFDGRPKSTGPDEKVQTALKHIFRGNPLAFGKKP